MWSVCGREIHLGFNQGGRYSETRRLVRTSSDLSGAANIASLTFDPEVAEGHVGVTDSWEVGPKNNT